MKSLEQELSGYAHSGIYPLHMPGHKRRAGLSSAVDVHLDFTEVEGTDDLHHPDGILKAAMQRTAGLYGAGRTWYLVNGSTCGNLAGIFSIAGQNGEVIAARNCHRSVFHALQLRNCRVHWAMPEYIPAYEIYGSIRPETIQALLEKYPQSSAVILTSPTYEGILSDIRAIAEICHAHHIPLMVDEAHGAHLYKGNSYFPEGAVSCGADIVVQSPHKTLYSVTQTAWMHLSGSLVQAEAIEKNLDIFETSSPSYPLLISLDSCSQFMLAHGNTYMASWCRALDRFYESVRASVHHMKILYLDQECFPDQIYAYDPGKILIHSPDAGRTGRDLQKILREEYRFETEMAEGRNVLAMTSAADEEAALCSFAASLAEMDAHMHADRMAEVDSFGNLSLPDQRMTLLEADQAEHVRIPLKEAAGETCGEYVYCYPPGIPLMIPGEVIDQEQISLLERMQKQGERIHFSETKDEAGMISVCRQMRRVE